MNGLLELFINRSLLVKGDRMGTFLSLESFSFVGVTTRTSNVMVLDILNSLIEPLTIVKPVLFSVTSDQMQIKPFVTFPHISPMQR